MAPTRLGRRVYANENDENAAGTTRLTRAKAAALVSTVDTHAGDPPKKALGVKKAGSVNLVTNAITAQPAKKRAALGEISNVNKIDANNENKPAQPKAVLSRGQKPAGVTKPTRTNSQRAALGQKSINATVTDLKRPASGSGVSGHVTKKRNTLSSKPANDDHDEVDEIENIPPPASFYITKNEVESTTPKEAIRAQARRYNEMFGEIIENSKDLDAEDVDDPLMVAEYVHEIFEYMFELEISTLPNHDYMANQNELEWKMRGILVDWLLEVHTRFRLLPETLFLAVNIIDRFLSRKVVQLDRLQLVGVTAMFIASKYEEVLSPHVQNFRHVADDGFTEAEILSAERYILAALDYDLSYPNPMNFLRRISKADNYDLQTRTLGKYLLEIGCLDHRFIQYPPSHVAAAAMYLARLVLERGDWDATLVRYASYTEEDIMPVFKLMVDYLAAPVTHEAFFRKYASKKFLKASIVLRAWAKKWAPFYLNGHSSPDDEEEE